MKKFLVTLVATASAASLSLAQVGAPADVGLIPKTPTITVNTNYNNNSIENGDVSITANGNVVMAWEDDDGGILDWEAVWTVYSSNGVLITPAVTMTNLPGSPCFPDPDSVTNWTYRAFFRPDGSPTPGYTGDYGGKMKGNQFGNGFMFSAGCDAIACEIPQLAAINIDDGGAGTGVCPFVQLLNNDGTPNTALGGPDVAGIVSFSDADVESAGTVRPGDVDFLANGNLLIVGESRQVADRALTGQAAGNVVVYKVLTSSGGVVKAYSAASSEASGQDMWHESAATANGFAIRFNVGSERIRLFDNNGNPQGPNIDLAAVTGHPEAGQGGRGDGTGFKSNGKDAYVYAAQTTSGPWVTVLNADGTVRYSHAVAETNESGLYPDAGRVDAAIADDGRVIVAFDASNNDTNNVNGYKLPQARLFDPCGRPIGPVFYLSERADAANATTSDLGTERVAWRGNTIAVTWQSANDPDTTSKVLAFRVFDVGPPPVSLTPVIPCNVQSVGLKTIVPDTLVWFSSSQNIPKIGGFVSGDDVTPGGSVEATAGLLGDSTFLLACTTYATNNSTLGSHTSLYQPAAGGAPSLNSLFYDDAGHIWKQDDNNSRQDGNPGRIAGDPRYGAVNFISAAEASLWAHPEFNSDARFTKDWYLWSGGVFREAFVQTHSMNPLTLASSPLMKAQDSAFGRYVAGTVPGTGADGSQLSRTGGTIVGLDNGNFVSVVEDRSRTFNANGNASTATIFGPNGSIVKDSFKVADADQWANVGAYKGGFFVRPSGGNFYFFDNAGNLQGSLNHNTASGLTYDTGRGDGTRSCADIRSHYVFFTGVAGTNVWLSAFDANTRTWIANTIVSEGVSDALDTGGLRNLDRCNIACDANNNVTVVYKVKPDNLLFPNYQTAARVFSFNGTSFSALTPSFYPFIEHDSDPDNVAAFVSQEPSVAMTTRQIFIYAEGSWNATANPTNVPVTAAQTHCYTIVSHPAPAATTRPAMTITQSGGHAIISWPADAGLFTVQKATTLTSPSWTDVTAGNVATPVDAGAIGATPTYFQLVRKY